MQSNDINAFAFPLHLLPPSIRRGTSPPVPYVGQGCQQGLEDVAVAVALMKIHCLDDYGNLDLTNFEKAMKVYQEIRITRSSQILDFSKSLGEMQARRAGEDTLSRSNDNVLKGEVLMYGTLPVMRPGATHDYKDDIKRATEQHHLPEVTEEAAMEAVEYLLGGMASEAKSVSMPINSPLPVQKTEPLEKLVDPSARRDRQEELIAWTTSMLRHLIQKIVAHRNVLENKLGSSQSSHIDDHIGVYEEGKIVVDEVREVIEWPKNIRESNLKEEDPNEVELPQVVLDQLHSFVRSIAAFYRNNPCKYLIVKAIK